MSVSGIVVTASLLGIIWVRESSSTEPAPPPQARVARLATPEQLAGIQLAMAHGEESTPGSGRQVLLDYEPGCCGGAIAGSLQPSLQTVGIDWSMARWQGFLGFSFDFSMTQDGAGIQQGINLQWTIFWPMMDHLPVEVIQATLKGPNASPPGEYEAAKRRAWTAVRGALDAGRPAILWQAITAERRWSEERQGPLPWNWSLVVGYDQDAGTITARHSNAGEVTIRWDELGHADPSNWFCAMIVDASDEPVDELAANRQTLERALEASQGKHPGTQEPAAHGLAAYEMWLAALQAGTASGHDVVHHATYLTHRRSEAAVYLSEVDSVFPEAARGHLRAAAKHYDAEVDAMEELRGMFDRGGAAADQQKGAVLVSKALEHERAALAEIQLALDAS